jgi:hypothetical protein
VRLRLPAGANKGAVDVEERCIGCHYLAVAPTGALANSSSSSRLNAGR